LGEASSGEKGKKRVKKNELKYEVKRLSSEKELGNKYDSRLAGRLVKEVVSQRISGT